MAASLDAHRATCLIDTELTNTVRIPVKDSGARDDNLSRVEGPARDHARGRGWHSPLPVRPRLVLASALMLFLELALIRWTGSNIVHLSYFSNFVLLGSFLGIGLGIPACRPDESAAVLLARSCWLVRGVRGRLSGHGRPRQDSSVIYFTSLTTTGPPAWVILPIVFVRGRGHPGRPGRAGRPMFRRAAAADGLPVRPDRQPARHRRVHRAVVPRARRRSGGA